MQKLAIAALILAAAVPSFAADPACKPNWGYTEEDKRPEKWGTIGYRLCGNGLRQSPIDFRIAGRKDDPTLHPVSLNRQQLSTFDVQHRAYDLEVKEVKPAWRLSWQGRRATLVQFHFHVPAEHYLDGHQYDAEIHFLFQENGKTDKIVIALWIKKGRANAALEKIIDLKPKACPLENPSGDYIKIKMDDFLSTINSNHYATYEGSLTTPTPTCSEDVTFIMMLEPIEASPEQIDALRIVKDSPGNVRPLQMQHVRLRH